MILKNNIFSAWISIALIMLIFSTNTALPQSLKLSLNTLCSSFNTFSENFKLLKERLEALQKCLSSSHTNNFTLFHALVQDMKYYKTTNSDHSGHLYEHSMWVARSVDYWFETQSEWVEGIDKKYRNLIVLAAFLHDVGKAANPNYAYSIQHQHYFNTTLPHLNKYPSFGTIGSHPADGFNYFIISKHKPYRFSTPDEINKSAIRTGNILDFDKLLSESGFKALGFGEDEIKIIAILIGIHYDFGASIVSHFSESASSLNNHFNALFIQHIKELASTIGYEAVNDQLIRLSILIGAADVRGIQPQNIPGFDDFINRYTFFSSNKQLFENPHAHGNSTRVADLNKQAQSTTQSMWTAWHYPQRALKARKKLLQYSQSIYPPQTSSASQTLSATNTFHPNDEMYACASSAAMHPTPADVTA